MSLLGDLRPREKLRVMDLVEQAGMDVSDWARFKGGRERAAVNPKYCYEWAFIKPGRLIVLNCWWDELYADRGKVSIDVSMREWATRNHANHGKPVWTKRALRFDHTLQVALRDKLPIRLILCDGVKRRADDPSARASSVKRRSLDTSQWAITAYDYTTGEGRLTRGARPTVTGKLGIPSLEVRQTLSSLAKQVNKNLSHDPRAGTLLSPSDRRAYPVDSGGYAIEIGQLRKGPRVEIWLDYCSGQATPGLWVGFTSESRSSIDRLLTLETLGSMGNRLVRVTSSEVTSEPFFHFRRSLSAASFDQLVREDYGPHYLGIYYQHSWPISASILSRLAREAAGFVAMVCVAERSSFGEDAPGGTLGRWARPNPRAEKAAVRHVTRHLRKLGYTVLSREEEICGYDLHASKDSEELHVEVKGCSRASPRFFISRNEIETAKRDPSWRLAVVTNATGRPRTAPFLSHRQMNREFQLAPTQWEGRSRI